MVKTKFNLLRSSGEINGGPESNADKTLICASSSSDRPEGNVNGFLGNLLSWRKENATLWTVVEEKKPLLERSLQVFELSLLSYGTILGCNKRICSSN